MKDFCTFQRTLPGNCPICSGSVKLTRSDGISCCRKCGVRFFAGYRDVPAAVELYGRNYFQGNVYSDYPAEAGPRIRLFRKKMKLLRSYLPGTGRVLDVGCAYGFFLQVARELGFHAQGVDISGVAAEFARSSVGVEVFHGELLDAAFPDSQFDVVTLWDTLEHLHKPHAMLREVYRILKPGGVLVIETLNVNTIARHILRRRWPLSAPPYHLFYFTKRTARRLIRNAGFTMKHQFPVQTYAPSFDGVRCIRYFGNPALRLVLGSFCADVVLYVALKPQHRS
jgi:SAM-dependent methyltransferase